MKILRNCHKQEAQASRDNNRRRDDKQAEEKKSALKGKNEQILLEKTSFHEGG